ncbi:MAG TPA: SUMF1/EgtB/PvdO family nonheme iron enzyme [Planctomycetota bacterium]
MLIPAGKFIMGTPEPVPVDEAVFRQKIVTGQAVFAVGGGVLLVLLLTAIISAIRQRHRPQMSLARFTVMIMVAGVAVLGGVHWLHSARALAQAQTEYKGAWARFKDSGDWDKPAHDVTLTTPFYMDKYSVTQAQYQQVMGANPSRFEGVNLPVETVSWDDSVAFCKKVSKKTGLIVRLPTDAEREYACRAGTTTLYYTGDSEDDLDKAAWYGVYSFGTTHPVGQKLPNAWGLYDMHGNVWEWCSDWYEEYKPDAVINPQGPSEGLRRVLRGSAWNHLAPDCRAAYRIGFYPTVSESDVGFRMVVDVASKTP